MDFSFFLDQLRFSVVLIDSDYMGDAADDCLFASRILRMDATPTLREFIAQTRKLLIRLNERDVGIPTHLNRFVGDEITLEKMVSVADHIAESSAWLRFWLWRCCRLKN